MASANDKMILVNERLAETIEAQKQIIQDQAQAIKHQAQRLFGSVMTLREIDDELRSLRKSKASLASGSSTHKLEFTGSDEER